MPTAKGGYIYIMSNKLRTVLYIGMCANLISRAYEHKNGQGCDFTKKYQCFDLIYYEFFETIEEAIEREKQLKNGEGNGKKI
jgi:putative endonuclease